MATAQKYAKDQPSGFTNRVERVAIVGAGGQIGGPMARALVKTGNHTVTAITRVGSENKLPEGLSVVRVDYDDDQALVSALRGQQFFIITMGLSAPADSIGKLIAAGVKAGVPYILPNCFGIDHTNPGLAKDSRATGRIKDAIQAVEESGVSSWFAMTCSFWYEYSLALPPAYGVDVANKKVTFFDDGTTPINTSTWDQCGRAIAGLLSLPELPQDENDASPTISKWRNKPLFISSFLASQRDMLDSIHRVLGDTDADWTIEYEPHEARYKRGLEMFNSGDQTGFIICLYTRTFYPNGDGNYEARHGLANDDLGLPKEDFDEATKKSIGMAQSGWNPFTSRGSHTG